MLQHTHSYEARWPRSTHWRKATCREVNCGDYLNGWVTSLDPRIYEAQAYFIEHDRERTYKKVVGEDGKNHYFFEAGQRCFDSEHYKKLDRGPWLLKNAPRYGLGAATERYAVEPDRWIDDFNTTVEQSNKGR